MAEDKEYRIALRIPLPDYKAMQRAANKEDLSISQLVRRAIREFLEKK